MRLAILTLMMALLTACVATPPAADRPDPKKSPASQAAGPTLRPITEDELTAKVQRFVAVQQRIEPVLESACRSANARRNCDFELVVDPRPELPGNAFQTLDPQGRPVLGFTLALIAEARNSDEIAFIMSHEAAHHILGHLSRQETNAAIGAQIFGRLASAAGGDARTLSQAQRIGAAVGARRYSKDFELEADRLGARLAIDAGYDPVRGAAFFFRVPDPGDKFLGTHPAHADRIAAVREAARL